MIIIIVFNRNLKNIHFKNKHLLINGFIKKEEYIVIRIFKGTKKYILCHSTTEDQSLSLT